MLFRSREELAAPVLIGLSRKSFIGKVLATADEPLPVEERLAGSLACHARVAADGADILRVHDVAETVQFFRMLEAIDRVERE